jgi:hypothetical protein
VITTFKHMVMYEAQWAHLLKFGAAASTWFLILPKLSA